MTQTRITSHLKNFNTFCMHAKGEIVQCYCQYMAASRSLSKEKVFHWSPKIQACRTWMQLTEFSQVADDSNLQNHIVFIALSTSRFSPPMHSTYQ